MKITIICYLAAFLSICGPWQKGDQVTNNCEFHIVLYYEIRNSIILWLKANKSLETVAIIYPVYSISCKNTFGVKKGVAK